MKSRQLFQRNLDRWSKTCPKQAFMLPYTPTNSLEQCETAKGEPNLKNTVNGIVYHSSTGAMDEANAWFDALPLDETPLICVYGVGLGYYYEAIRGWLKKNRKRRLIFLEDDLAVIHKLFETELGCKILGDFQVQLLYFSEIKDKDPIFVALYWDLAMGRVHVSALSSYAENKKNRFEALKHKILYDSVRNNALVNEYMDYGANFYFNFYQNLLHLPKSYLGNQLFGKFHYVPAIICGAGPSLNKHLPLLEKLLDRAVVFAGGSAVNALNSAGLNPHFGAGIDPNASQLVRMQTNTSYEVPFFYRNRMHHEAFKAIGGPCLYITGAGGYDTAEYFEKKFNINAEFIDEGHNVVNFCVEVAHAMGCDPIIFVGMDLAFTGMQAYSSGVVEDAKITDAEILEDVPEEQKAFIKEDIFGNPTYTVWKWVTEADWIGDFAKTHPSAKLINCTEGGIGFPGVMNQTLQEVADTYLQRRYELKNRIHGETQNCKMPQMTRIKMVRAMKALKESLHQLIDHLSVLIDEARKMIVKLKEGDLSTQVSGRAVLAETELTDEIGYKYVLDIFNTMYSSKLSSKGREIRLRHASPVKQLLRKLPLNIKKYIFLRDVARVNAELIAHVLSQKESKQHREVSTTVTFNSSPAKYHITKGRMCIEDPEMHLSVDEAIAFIKIPEERRDGLEIAPGYILRAYYDNALKLCECYVEKDQKCHGQCLLFYSDGTVKEECFYWEGFLHGPSTFRGPKGELLASSWYVHGSQVGKCLWYYPSGVIYSVQRYQDNVWDGPQEFYYSDGTLKRILHYSKGELVKN